MIAVGSMAWADTLACSMAFGTWADTVYEPACSMASHTVGSRADNKMSRNTD
jgi:hypothetical protein